MLAAIAAGADVPSAIAAQLDLTDGAVAAHLEALETGGFVRREGDRLVLTERVTGFLDGLVGRIDLLAIAAPIVLETETRLGLRIDLDVPDEHDPAAIRGSEPFALVPHGPDGRALVACVLDTAGKVACVLRMPVDGVDPATIPVLGKELVVAADAVTVRLPQMKDRGPDFRFRI